MTVDELEQETHDLIDAIATQAPGSRHLHLGRLHGIMAAYSRSGRAAPVSLRRLLDELTSEIVEARYENMPV
jgi:hypothetical protein